MTWYWAALVGFAAWLSPFMAMGAIGAYITHRRRAATNPRARKRKRSIYDWATETADSPPLDARDVRLWERQIRSADEHQIMQELDQ